MADMEGMEARLDQILGDPKAMNAIADLAQKLMAGGQDGEAPPQPPKEASAPALAGLLGKLSANGGGDSRQRQLLQAMRPYLKEERRRKMDRALRLARMARLAETALSQLGGEEDGL